MVLLAYIPPLWFAVMDKRVIRHYRGDLSRINWYGPRREALMARYADEAAAQARRSASTAA